MRNVLCLALLVPILALAAGTTQPVTALAPEDGAANVIPSPALAPANQGPNIPARALVGTLDTIGGTTYDWWTNGPRLRMLVRSGPQHGVHALWMYSTLTNDTLWPDRNMRYNYYDDTLHAWNWIGPDYMNDDGVNVFDKKAGYGNIDADPMTGNAIVGGHSPGTGGITPRVAKDAAPGAGIFDYADGEPVLGVCQWPPIAVGQDGQVNIFPITGEAASPAYRLSYSNIAAGNWPTFSTPQTGFDPSPLFPTHNIAASKASSKVALTWSINVGVGSGVEDGYVDFSTDGGATWDGPTLLALPAAYGTDTVTSCHITSLFPWYDAQDKFHIVANFAPCGPDDTVRAYPSQIWHYCPDNAPQWSLIHVATADSFASGVTLGYNATFACRPNIGQDDDGNLFVVWEQFDPLNYEPTTMFFRADIFAARSTDNGATWGAALKLTDAGSYSMRFPSVIDLAVEGDPDTMYVLYEIDSIAGFFVQSQGAATPNPVVVQKVVVTDLPVGVAEQKLIAPTRLEAVANPNPFGGRTQVSYMLPQSGNVSLVVYDVAGRPVQTLASGRRAAGRYTATWDAKNAAAGVYFYTLTSGKASITRKLILAD